VLTDANRHRQFIFISQC